MIATVRLPCELHFNARRFDEGLPASGRHDVRSGFGQPEGDRTADARRAANDDGDAARQRQRTKHAAICAR